MTETEGNRIIGLESDRKADTEGQTESEWEILWESELQVDRHVGYTRIRYTDVH